MIGLATSRTVGHRRGSRCGSTARRTETSGTANQWEGVSEMRIDYGPGYRVYYKRAGQEVVILLAGGDKSTQEHDIKTALRIAREL
jgi:putative addiction module killer protein